MEYIMDYVTTLEDFWVHGNENRQSGKRWSFFITPDYSFWSNTVKDKQNEGTIKVISKFNRNFLVTRFGLRFAYEKPINLFWQNSIWSAVDYRLQNERRMDYNVETEEKHIRYISMDYHNFTYRFNQQFSYYPTTRTQLWVHSALQYSLSFRKEKDSKEYYHTAHVRTEVGATYFFSPYLQLKFNPFLLYRFHQTDRDTKYEINSGPSAGSHRWQLRGRDSALRFHLNLSLNYTFY